MEGVIGSQWSVSDSGQESVFSAQALASSLVTCALLYFSLSLSLSLSLSPPLSLLFFSFLSLRSSALLLSLCLAQCSVSLDPSASRC